MTASTPTGRSKGEGPHRARTGTPNDVAGGAPEDAQALIDAIRVLRIELRIANDRVAAAAGLNPRDLDVLDVIDRDSPCTPGHLTARTGIRAATLTGILARLETGGWIHRQAAPGDARSAYLTPTRRFEELRDLYLPVDSGVRHLAATQTADSLHATQDLLERAVQVIRDAADIIAGVAPSADMSSTSRDRTRSTAPALATTHPRDHQ